VAVSETIQVYYNYDKAVVDFLGGVSYDGKPILRVFATPERAFAQVKKWFKERRDRDVRTIPLPIVSLFRIAAALDHARYHKTTRYHKMYYTPDRKKYYGMRYPQPVTLTFQIDLWARLIRDLEDATAQFLQKFRINETYLTVKHPFPMGERLVLTLLRDELGVDTTGLEAGGEQRTLRRTFTLDVYGWVSYPADEFGIVEQIETTIIESDDPAEGDEGSVLDVVTVS